MKNDFDLVGRVCVVTGGAGLLGRAFVEGLALHGATVYIAESDMPRAQAMKDDLNARGYTVLALEMDICNPASVKTCIESVLSKYGTIDGWVNNAYPRTSDWGLPFEMVPAESWRRNVDMHLNGYCLCCQAVASVMREHKTGSIVNIASVYGLVGPDFTVYEGTKMTMPAAYAAIKGGIINFTRYLASYYGPYGIRANALSPGGIFDNQPEAFVSRYNRKVPLGRMAAPRDFVGPLTFLISDASRYVTGHNLVVDGGWTAI